MATQSELSERITEMNELVCSYILETNSLSFYLY